MVAVTAPAIHHNSPNKQARNSIVGSDDEGGALEREDVKNSPHCKKTTSKKMGKNENAALRKRLLTVRASRKTHRAMEIPAVTVMYMHTFVLYKSKQNRNHFFIA